MKKVFKPKFNFIINKLSSFLNNYLIFLIVLLNFIFKWHNIDNFPYGLEGDEITWSVSSLLTKYSIPPSSVGVWSLIENLAKIFPVSITLNQVSFYLFGYSLFSPRKMLVLISSLSLIFFYLFLQKFISKKAALLTVFWYSFSAYFLATSSIPLQHGFNAAVLMPSLLFLAEIKTNLEKNNLKKTIFYSFLSSLFILLSLFTYNLTFLMPLVGIVWIFFLFIALRKNQSHFKLKNWLMIFTIYCVPFLIFTSAIYQLIHTEFQTRSYALGNAMFNNQQTFNNFFSELINKLATNWHTIFNQLFTQGKNSFGDMLIPSGYSILDYLILPFFLLGLAISFTKLKKYAFLTIWFTFGLLIYHLIFGLNCPRMWAISFILLSSFIGVGIDWALQFFSKKKYVKFIGTFITFLIILLSINLNVQKYFELTTKQTSFRVNYREINNLISTFEYNQFFNTLYISTQLDDFNIHISFNFIAKYPNQVDFFRTLDKTELGLIKLETLQNIAEESDFKQFLTQYQYLVVENQLIDDKKITWLDQLPLNLINQSQYFSYYVIEQ